MTFIEGPCCPLRNGVPCIEEKCAWWNFFDDECTVKTLGTLATIEIGGRER